MSNTLAHPFVVASEASVWRDHEVSAGLLESHRAFKTLSLLLADIAGVNVPASLLLLARRADIASDFARVWGYPLMIRLDYRQYPRKKPLGGIPIYRHDIVVRVCDYIFEQACFPLFHPHIDRFQDLHSVGILLNKSDYQAEVEVVGPGFDAGDLRRGIAIPHERLSLDLASGTVKRRTVIPALEYGRDRAIRVMTATKLASYIDSVNRSGVLASDLNGIDPGPKRGVGRAVIPEKYTELPCELVEALIEIGAALWTSVIPALPQSKSYVASLSCVEGRGWVLWDVYGEWYRR
jgi:hypothetical protein